MDKIKIKSLLIKNRKLLEEFGVKRIGLFGSYLREQNTSDSDIDLLIEADEDMSLLKFADLQIRLGEIFNHKIDLVSINGMSKYIKPSVMKEVEFVEEL